MAEGPWTGVQQKGAVSMIRILDLGRSCSCSMCSRPMQHRAATQCSEQLYSVHQRFTAGN